MSRTTCNPRITTTSTPPIITYRIGEKLVYVKPANTFADAVELAISEFPEELDGIPTRRITFSASATLNGEKRAVRISETAWSDATKRMLRGEVLDVMILPESDRKDMDLPPRYLDVPQDGGRLLCSCRSAPGSRAPSPTPSKKLERPRSWFRFSSD
ncbi:hypothetical protein V5O48_000705 [Marasmius crinis-equi]|uniref:Uncharacterized protein n=1 Tax=Marasmius crinis-equi TaxID=585013 RepID=A0ABR3G0R8_9AGAR